MHVHSKRKSIIGFHGHNIIPGGQDIPDHIVAKMLEDDIMMNKIESGELEVKDLKDLGAHRLKSKRPGGPDGLEVLLGGDERKVTQYASEVVDVKLLTRWLARETRQGVRDAIRANLEAINQRHYRGEQTDSTNLAASENAPQDQMPEANPEDDLGFTDADADEPGEPGEGGEEGQDGPKKKKKKR